MATAASNPTLAFRNAGAEPERPGPENCLPGAREPYNGCDCRTDITGPLERLVGTRDTAMMNATRTAGLAVLRTLHCQFRGVGAVSGAIAADGLVPAYSPYLNLLRPGNTAIDRYGLVRPQIDFQNQVNSLQQQYGSLNRDISGVAADQQLPLPTTGHAAQFISYSHFYPGLPNGRIGRPGGPRHVARHWAGASVPAGYSGHGKGRAQAEGTKFDNLPTECWEMEAGMTAQHEDRLSRSNVGPRCTRDLGNSGLVPPLTAGDGECRALVYRRYPLPAGQLRVYSCFGYFPTQWQQWQMACSGPDGVGPLAPVGGHDGITSARPTRVAVLANVPAVPPGVPSAVPLPPPPTNPPIPPSGGVAEISSPGTVEKIRNHASDTGRSA